MKRIFAISIGFLAVTVIGIVLYFRLTAVPVRTQFPGWFFSQAWTPRGRNISPDRDVARVVWRARLDQFINPIPGTYRMAGILCVVHVREEGTDAIYFVFPESTSGDRYVIYHYSPTQGKLLWKATDSNPP